jgi:hypothetical protein
MYVQVGHTHTDIDGVVFRIFAAALKVKGALLPEQLDSIMRDCFADSNYDAEAEDMNLVADVQRWLSPILLGMVGHGSKRRKGVVPLEDDATVDKQLEDILRDNKVDDVVAACEPSPIYDRSMSSFVCRLTLKR